MTYRVFGLHLASDWAFANRLPASHSLPDLTFTCCSTAPLSLDWARLKPLYTSPSRNQDPQAVALFYRLEDCDVLRFAGVADFYLWPERIVCHASETTPRDWIEIQLLGSVLSFWLERQGVATLHASSVVVGQRAAVFLSGSHRGKSALAAAFLQAGHALLSDDILAVERKGRRFVGRPSYPSMRLWPEEARYFFGSWQDLPRVHPEFDKRRVFVGPSGFGAFCQESLPLGCIYLPQRQGPAQGERSVEITALGRAAGVVELMRCSFAPRLLAALELQSSRLDFFAQLVQSVPVRRLAYPSGLEHLVAVREAICTDLEEIAGAAEAAPSSAS